METPIALSQPVIPEEAFEAHEIKLPDGRIGKLPEPDYLRLEALGGLEGLSVQGVVRA